MIPMANSSRNATVGFRVTEEQKTEWDQWKAKADQDGLEFRDWLFPRVRQSLVPKPTRSAQPIAAIYRQGYRVGLMAGRLDLAFAMGQQGELDLGEIRRWAQKYPECVADLVDAMTAKSYGIVFDAWWQKIMTSLPSA